MRKRKTDAKERTGKETSEHGQVVVAWDPSIISEDEYAEVVRALGDLVRAEGGLGIERVRNIGHQVSVTDEVPV